MKKPSGKLSPNQFEIMSVVWDRGKKGATVSNVWSEISDSRPVIRSTIQNLMERLAARGWLTRRERKNGIHFYTTVSREEVEHQVTAEVVDHFFGGSAAHLVRGLFGTGKVSQEDIAELRKLLNEEEES